MARWKNNTKYGALEEKNDELGKRELATRRIIDNRALARDVKSSKPEGRQRCRQVGAQRETRRRLAQAAA